MGNVINFNSKESNHVSGEAFCYQCNHKWRATSPRGTVQLECPNCHTLKGLYKFPNCVPEGQLIRECDCGNDLFYLTPDGHLCPNCGLYQIY